MNSQEIALPGLNEKHLTEKLFITKVCQEDCDNRYLILLLVKMKKKIKKRRIKMAKEKKEVEKEVREEKKETKENENMINKTGNVNFTEA